MVAFVHPLRLESSRFQDPIFIFSILLSVGITSFILYFQILLYFNYNLMSTRFINILSQMIDLLSQAVYNVFEVKNMKKKHVLNLIKYYTEKNDPAFRNEAYEIARYFDSTNENALSEYIMALLSDVNTFSPQMNEDIMPSFRKVNIDGAALPLPNEIMNDISGMINAINHKAGVNKFLFEGAPGTGKTETAKQVARILDRELFIVDFETVVDSRLGQTAKNIADLFKEINSLKEPNKAIILFDEIDSIAIDRINSNDLREMGRATSAILKGIDALNQSVVLIATTNLFKAFDKALIRRFDAVINFNRYSREDLVDIALTIMDSLLKQFKFAESNRKILRKIIDLLEVIPYPGDLKNLLKTSIAFSNPDSKFDYLKRLFVTIDKSRIIDDLKKMQELGFTMREIEILTGVSKSQASRELKEEDKE